jgi:hypothetical protein
MAVETYFRSNRGVPKDGVVPKPPRCDPAAELDLAVVPPAASGEGRVGESHLMDEHTGLEEAAEVVMPHGYSHDSSVLDPMVDFSCAGPASRTHASIVRQPPPVSGPNAGRITASLGYTLTPMTLGFVTTHGTTPQGDTNPGGAWQFSQGDGFGDHDGTASEYPHHSVVDAAAYDHGSTDV